MTTSNLPKLESLQASVRGEILTGNSDNFDQVRAVWNAMIDRRPAIIVRCTGVADVKACLAFAKESGLEVCVRGGGHNIAGNAIGDDRLLIDLSLLRDVSVDPDKKIVTAGPGATLGDIDHETKEFGLALPTGINSTTGISGLVLGGGIGWLTRKYGMTCDNLLEAEVVLSTGEVVIASARENSDLLWALKGGGGNFGVVTRWTFHLSPVGDVYAGLVVFPAGERKSVLSKYREYASRLTLGTTIWGVLRKAPPLPFLPEDAHGADVVILAICHTGKPEEGADIVGAVQGFGDPVGTHAGPMPFASWQQIFDPLLEPGRRNYWKSHNVTELSDGFIDATIEFATSVPSPECELFFAHIEGCCNGVDPSETAYPHRHAKYVLNVHGRWQDPADDEFCVQWAKDFFEASKPFAAPGVYINFMTGEETDRVKDGFGPNYDRLRRIKARYDPENRFNLNQNIEPSLESV